MPKKERALKINLDLLRPQSQPQRLAIRLFKWLLSSGRFLIIVVEVIVLGAFLFRFKLDADIESTREAIDEQIPFIESLSTDEVAGEKLIRQTQFQLATIKDIKQNSPDYTNIMSSLAKQTPAGVVIKNLNIQRNVDSIDLKLTATASDNNQLASFIAGLKSDAYLSNIDLSDVTLEGGGINFSVTASLVVNKAAERKL